MGEGEQARRTEAVESGESFVEALQSGQSLLEEQGRNRCCRGGSRPARHRARFRTAGGGG